MGYEGWTCCTTPRFEAPIIFDKMMLKYVTNISGMKLKVVSATFTAQIACKPYFLLNA